MISCPLTSNKAFEQGSLFCSLSRPDLQNEDPIDFVSVDIVPITPVDDDDEDEGVYADHVTSEEWQNFFGDSNVEDVAGFE